MKEGRETGVPGENPWLQKMPYTKARRFQPYARLEPAQQHWWQARKADVLTTTPHLAPKTCGTHRNRKTASQGEQQHNVNSAGTLFLRAEKSEELVIGVLASADQMAGCIPKGRLEDCEAWIRARGRPHDQISDQNTHNPMIRS